ncbi:MAG: hypothetical protein ACRCSF_06815, partial [Mycobacteriaceae bacterium]
MAKKILWTARGVFIIFLCVVVAAVLKNKWNAEHAKTHLDYSSDFESFHSTNGLGVENKDLLAPATNRLFWTGYGLSLLRDAGREVPSPKVEVIKDWAENSTAPLAITVALVCKAFGPEGRSQVPEALSGLGPLDQTLDSLVREISTPEGQFGNATESIACLDSSRLDTLRSSINNRINNDADPIVQRYLASKVLGTSISLKKVPSQNLSGCGVFEVAQWAAEYLSAETKSDTQSLQDCSENAYPNTTEPQITAVYRSVLGDTKQVKKLVDTVEQRIDQSTGTIYGHVKVTGSWKNVFGVAKLANIRGSKQPEWISSLFPLEKSVEENLSDEDAAFAAGACLAAEEKGCESITERARNFISTKVTQDFLMNAPANWAMAANLARGLEVPVADIVPANIDA